MLLISVLMEQSQEGQVSVQTRTAGPRFCSIRAPMVYCGERTFAELFARIGSSKEELPAEPTPLVRVCRLFRLAHALSKLRHGSMRVAACNTWICFRGDMHGSGIAS